MKKLNFEGEVNESGLPDTHGFLKQQESWYYSFDRTKYTIISGCIF